MSTPETGKLLGEFPYVRVGNGPRTLVVLPGVGDALFDGDYPTVAGWVLQSYFARYLDDYTVYLLSRPRGLSDGYTARESADDHARVLDQELGTVDVMGISMGGLIAQELCTNHSDLVDRLVLVSTGYRFADENRDELRQLRSHAERHAWSEFRARLARALFSDWRKFSYPPVILTAGRFFLPKPAVPSDVWVSVDLIREYDGSARLPDIYQPTFVFAGTKDPYFTEPIVRETAAGIPEATLSLAEGAKHGAFHERKRTFDDEVLAFLNDDR